jgi:hypothetical protein
MRLGAKLDNTQRGGWQSQKSVETSVYTFAAGVTTNDPMVTGQARAIAVP